jgi:hypothetical protein
VYLEDEIFPVQDREDWCRHRKKRSCSEEEGSARDSSPPTSPPRPNPNKEWKKSKAKTEDLLALVNSGFLREKEVDMWLRTRSVPVVDG